MSDLRARDHAVRGSRGRNVSASAKPRPTNCPVSDAQCQAGDHHAGAATLQRAIDKAEATGDVRLAARARVHLGRILRALGRLSAAPIALEVATVWHRTAQGGEQAALGQCLLAAIDAADRDPGAEERLLAILDNARRDDHAQVEAFALDALAASQLKRATSPPHGTSVSPLTGAWKPPPTSSPSTTEPTPTPSGKSTEAPPP